MTAFTSLKAKGHQDQFYSDQPQYLDREAGWGSLGDCGDPARRRAPMGLSLVLSSSWFPLKYFMGIKRK